MIFRHVYKYILEKVSTTTTTKRRRPRSLYFSFFLSFFLEKEGMRNFFFFFSFVGDCCGTSRDGEPCNGKRHAHFSKIDSTHVICYDYRKKHCLLQKRFQFRPLGSGICIHIYIYIYIHAENQPASIIKGWYRQQAGQEGCWEHSRNSTRKRKKLSMQFVFCRSRQLSTYTWICFFL